MNNITISKVDTYSMGKTILNLIFGQEILGTHKYFNNLPGKRSEKFYRNKLGQPEGTLNELYNAMPIEKKEPLNELLFSMIKDKPNDRPDIPTLLDILDKIM